MLLNKCVFMRTFMILGFLSCEKCKAIQPSITMHETVLAGVRDMWIAVGYRKGS